MFFDGAPLWHCSVAHWRHYERRPLPVSSLDRETRTTAVAIAHEQLAGVGIPNSEVIQGGETAIHVRRKATAAEIAAGAPWRKLKGRP